MIDLAALILACVPNASPIVAQVLPGVVKHESVIYQYAIGVNGGHTLPRAPRDKHEAVETARWLASNGYDFDAGYGQVNRRNWQWLGLDAESVFDPCANLQASARVLEDCLTRANGDIGAGLSCYNTGNFRDGFKNGYVAKVAANLPVPVLMQEGGPTLKVVPKKKERDAISSVVEGGGKPAPGQLAKPGEPRRAEITSVAPPVSLEKDDENEVQ